MISSCFRLTQVLHDDKYCTLHTPVCAVNYHVIIEVPDIQFPALFLFFNILLLH